MTTDTESDSTPGLGELSRQVRDVLNRFEKLATQLEGQFVRKDMFDWQRRAFEKELRDVAADLKGLEKRIEEYAQRGEDDLKEFHTKVESDRVSTHAHGVLVERVSAIEDALKWVTRLVLSFVIMGILASAIYFGKPGGP